MRFSYIGLFIALFTTLSLLAETAYGTETNLMQAEQFEIPTKDGKTKLRGEINFRGDKSRARPTVFLLHGTGPAQRDYIAQDALADASQFSLKYAMFLIIAEALTNDGYAVVRFDTRGVKCSQLSCPDCGHDPQPKRWGELCVDNAVRLTASLTAVTEDIQTIHDYALTRPMVDKERTAFITHSAGSFQLGPLILRKTVIPRMVIMLAGLAESTLEGMQWQNTDRIVTIAKKCDLNRDGLLTRDEIDRCGLSPMTKSQVIQPLHLDEGPKTINDISTSWLSNRKLEINALIKNILASDENARNQPGGMVAGAVVGPMAYSYELFQNKQPVVEFYSGMTGKLIYYIGGKDSSIDIDRQRKAILLAERQNKKISIRTFSELGHSLGKDELVGPMDDAIVPHLIKDLQSAFE